MLKKIKAHHHFMWSNSRNLVRSFARPSFVYLLFATLTIMSGFSILFHWIESPTNPRIGGWLDSLYFTVATMTSVGFGDIVPVTVVGKVFTIVMMLAGSAIYVSFTAVVASTILELDWEDLDQK